MAEGEDSKEIGPGWKTEHGIVDRVDGSKLYLIYLDELRNHKGKIVEKSDCVLYKEAKKWNVTGGWAVTLRVEMVREGKELVRRDMITSN